VDDYLTEKEQWERIKAFVREEGPWVLAAVAVVALAFNGWLWWQNRGERRAQDASARYEQVLLTFDRGQRDRGLALIEELRRDYAGSPYVDQADLAAARVFVEEGDLDKAAERLRVVAQGSRDSGLATIARLRLARVQISQGKAQEALATLGPSDDGAFAAGFHEVRGDAYLAKGDKPAALREYLAAQVVAGPGAGANELLVLKIQDLAGEGRGTPPAAASR
jgi:predicted negative regulator of RcsB-dependent stress response